MLSLPLRERREYRVYRSLLGMVPGLEERLLTAGDEEMRMIADLVSFFWLANSPSPSPLPSFFRLEAAEGYLQRKV